MSGRFSHLRSLSHVRASVRPAGEEARLADAAERAPRSTAARQALGRYYLDHGQPFEAVWELDQARVLDPGDRTTRLALATALALARLYPEAETELRAVVAQPPRSRAGRQELAALYLATARPEQAVSLLRAAPGLDNWSDGQLLLGRAYEGLGQAATARRAYERSIRLSPSSTEGAFRLAHLLLTSHDPRAARAVLTAALRRAPREARLLQLMAMTYSARWGDGEQPDHQGQLLTMAMQSGGAMPAHLALGELDLRHGRFAEAGIQLAPAAEQAGWPVAHRGLAAALVGMGEPAEACYHRGMADVLEGHADLGVREFQAMAAKAPRDPRAPRLISQADVQIKHLNAALKAVKDFYQRGGRSPELYERLAELYMMTYDRRAARQICEEWRRAQPGSGRPLAYLGRVSKDDLRLTEAVNDYQEAVAAEPKNAQNLLGLADALAQQPSPENSRRALALLRQAVALAPHDPAARYQLGVRLQQMGQVEEARRALLAALDDNPTLAAADNNLLQIATALRQPGLARRFGELMRAVQARQRESDAAWKRRWERPADPQVYDDLARLLASAGDLAGADYQLQRALVVRPGWPEAVSFHDRLQRLLDGLDADGRGLAQFPEAVSDY